jgi:hypothetical protein
MQATCTTLLNSKRSNIANYSWFYDDVLSTVVGRNHWRKQCLQTTGTALASVTDEALGLLIVDNCWASWCIRSAGPDEPDVLIEALAAVDPDTAAGVDWDSLTKEKKVLARKSRAKAILGLTKYTSRTAGAKGTGWSEEGIDKFNELCVNVAKDRANDKGKFDAYYMKQKNISMQGKRQRGCGPTRVKPVYDDFSD